MSNLIIDSLKSLVDNVQNTKDTYLLPDENNTDKNIIIEHLWFLYGGCILKNTIISKYKLKFIYKNVILKLNYNEQIKYIDDSNCDYNQKIELVSKLILINISNCLEKLENNIDEITRINHKIKNNQPLDILQGNVWLLDYVDPNQRIEKYYIKNKCYYRNTNSKQNKWYSSIPKVFFSFLIGGILGYSIKTNLANQN